RGLEKNGYAHLRDARACYALWGADGKVRQLDRRYPQLAVAEEHRPTATMGAPVHQLDLATVVKASQALSSEIVLSKLIERLMTIALENAGADRGLLILPAEDDHLIQAEARAIGEQAEVVLGHKSITGITCPASLVRYVIRTHERVIVDDASRPNLFSDDDYLRGRQAKSILCLPLIKQGRLTGLLYLENTLTAHAFTPDRIAVLELLAAQAAISLENTRLYSDLQEREAKVRRLVDSNIIGVYFWELHGGIIDANDTLLRMLGCDREDLVSGRVRWLDLTPPEWRDRTARATEELKTTGSVQPFEKEYFRKDGSRVPVLIGSGAFDGRRDQGVGFVLGLTERKRAEAEARESERRVADLRTEMARVNRVALLGQLTASIAHEVNQPIASTRNNASAALNFLDTRPPELDEAREALRCIVNDADRAGSIVGRIRDQVRKVPPHKDDFDINDALKEVIASVRGEVTNNGVSVQTRFGFDLPPIQADRVQLQQVILNLILNAVEAMSSVDEARELLISTEQNQADGVLVSVGDTGPGVDPGN